MAEVCGASNKLPQIRLNVTARQQITRFILAVSSNWDEKLRESLGLEDSTTRERVPQAARKKCRDRRRGVLLRSRSAGRNHESADDQHSSQDKSNDSTKLFSAHDQPPLAQLLI
jgi:hypothetical protein